MAKERRGEDRLPQREVFMERRLNLAALMGLALLLLAATATAADTQEQNGAVSGKKFCLKNADGLWVLSQQPASYEAHTGYVEDDDGGSSYVVENCYDLWYDAEHHEEYEPLVSSSSYYDAYTDLSVQLSEGESVELGSDIDFGGIASGGTACVAAFKPLDGLSKKIFKGNNHTIKNLCYIRGGADQSTSGIGFFSKVEGAKAGVSDLKFEDVYISTAYGSPAGVVAGTVWGASTFSNITLKNVKVIAATAGGVVGESNVNVNNAGRASFKDIVGEQVQVLASSGAVPASAYEFMGEIYEIYLGGLVGEASAGISVMNVGFTDLKVSSEIYSIEMYSQQIGDEDPDHYSQPLVERLGGLAGALTVGSNANEGIDINNTYTVGDISAPLECDRKHEQTCKVGFVAGGVYASNETTAGNIFVGNNYHYGKTDYMARNVAGLLMLNSIDRTEQWTQARSSDAHVFHGGVNYRNAMALKDRDTLPVMANMDTVSYQALIADVTNYGGFLADSSMKRDAFAAALNNWQGDAMAVSRWSRKTGVNDGLPVFASENLKAIYWIDFYGSKDYYETIKGNSEELGKWKNAKATIDEQSEMVLHLVAATDYTGKIGNTTWQKNAAAISNGSYYWAYFDETAQKVSGFSLTASTVFKSPMNLALAERTSITVIHGFIEYGEDDFGGTTEEFISVDAAATKYRQNYYFLGEPAKKISSDSTWLRVPYLATSEGVSTYYGFYFANRFCELVDGKEMCSFSTMDASGAFYVNALNEMSNGDTLYVIYLEEPVDVPGGNLYTSDLHGEYFDLDKANVQMMARDTTGERAPLGDPDNLTIESTASALMDNMLYGAYANWETLPYSPFFKANYPSDTWNKVTDIVGLVVVGGAVAGGDSYSDALMKSATQTLRSVRREHPYLKDTLSALDSPEEIRAMMAANAGADFVYARYVHMGKDGTLDLTNLFAAIASVRETEDDYPIYVGLLPQLAGMEYHVSFSLDMESYAYGDYSPLFVGDLWIHNKDVPDSTYTKKTGSEALINTYDWRLFRTDACYTGNWSAEDPTGEYDGSTDLYSINSLEEDFPFVENEDGSRSLTVHPHWEEGYNGLTSCYDVYWPKRSEQDSETEEWVWVNSIVKDNSEGGNIVLQQVWNGVTLRHMSTYLSEGYFGIYIPYVDSVGFTFEVYADGYDGFELDGKIKLAWEDSDEDPIPLNEGDTVYVPGRYRGGMEFYANYTYKKFNIAFVSGKKDVLYGEGSDSVGVYKLESEDDIIDLPRWVYTEDNCVDGWKMFSDTKEDIRPIQEDGDNPNWNWNEDYLDRPDNWDATFEAFDYMLSEELDRINGKRQEKYPLYASWVDAKTCVKDLGYKQARLEVAENGLVEFKELRKDSKGKVVGTQVHKFAKDSTMLLPAGVNGSNFVVLGAPAKGYMLDSLIMTLGGKKYVYHEGDTLSGDIATATFAAYFMPENSTPATFAKAELLQSGGAVRFDFVTSEFGASGASVRVVLENNDGKKLVDSVFAVTKTPYTGSWEYYPLRAGTYLLTATVKNSRTSDLFEQDFEVKSTIASKEDGWRMLSLSNVIMDSVIWDDDVRFYWWDDSKNYGTFWRYQRLMEEDEVNNLTGYWYSSLKGRPLVMRDDMNPPKDPVVWNMDSIYTGWNMVANPYGWYVDLYGENPDKKKSPTEESEVEFWSWNDSLKAYEEVDVVAPYAAVWAKVKGPSQWKLPSKPAFVATVDEEGEEKVVEPLKKTIELSSNGKNGWAIRAVLRDGKGKSDSWNIMGVSESGWASEEPPSGMGDRVNLSIKDGRRSLAKSFKKASGDSYEWTISLDASGERAGYLHFEGLETLRTSGLKVFVTVDGTTTQMAENDTLKVAIGSLAKTATVRVAPTARTVVAQKLNGLRAFQAGNSLQVGFQVSESLAGAKAYVEILDMKGKVLSSTSGTVVSGSNSMTLQTPKSGLYMVRVRVGGKQAAGSIAVK